MLYAILAYHVEADVTSWTPEEDATLMTGLLPAAHGVRDNGGFRLAAERRTLAEAFAAFEAQRKPDAEAIQQMALENYIEMRDKVDDAGFLLQRQLELALQERHPGLFVPHYAMVSFMRIPYSQALHRSEIQRTILEDATRGASSLDAVDWNTVDAAVRALLAPL